MGYEKHKRPLLLARGAQARSLSTSLNAPLTFSTNSARVEHVQTLTGASTGTTITNYGLTKITWTSTQSTATNYVYTLAAPVAGIEKRIIGWEASASTKTITVRTLTSAATFAGSTKNSFTWTTGSTYLPANVHLSTSQWAVLSANTPLVTSTAGVDNQLTIAGATA